MRHPATLAFGALAVLAACATNPRVEAAGDVATTTPATGRYLTIGSPLDVRLDQTLGASTSHDGDSFTATVINPLLAQNGETVVPAGATVMGHVTGLSKSNLPGQASVIRLDFDNLRFNGNTYPFNASVNDVHVENQSGMSTSSVTKGAVTGAAAGGALGVILGGGDLSNLIKGGLLGAAAGTAISLGMDAMHSDLPAGSTMTLRATQDVRIR